MGAEKSNAYSSVNGIEDIAKKALTEVSVIAITRVIINFGKTGLNDVMSEKKGRITSANGIAINEAIKTI
jgi:hypothetical protein